MTDIEKAIEYFDGYGSPFDDLIIQALQEKAERDKGCEHCRGWDKRCGANYCPMCGKELGEWQN